MKKIYALKIQLAGITKPPVWRKVLVVNNCTLADLHNVIQAVMPWDSCHLHAFHLNGRMFTASEYGLSDGEMESAAKVTLEQAFASNKKIGYTYDFGDNWEHIISLEKVLERDPTQKYPRMTSGKGACPPEDCGGAWGYENLKEVLANPNHEEYEEMREWLGLDDDEEFDPNYFETPNLS